jgi:hypothetical protein
MSDLNKTDPRAVVSLIVGLAAFMFTFRPDTWSYFLVLPLGVGSVWAGVGVLREGKPGMGISVAGVVLATIALCIWVLSKL